MSGERAVLDVDGLRAGYLVEPVLKGINFSVAPGEVLAILGPNGVGKTTLFKCLSGLHREHEGSVRMGERVLDGVEPEERARAGLMHVPEGRRLFRDMSTLDNLKTGLCAGRRGPSIDDVLDLFPRLQERLATKAGNLSGGEQQMLTIGRALLGDPQVLLIDEPSLGLAPLLVQAVFEALGELAKEGRAVVIAEQNVAVATKAADRCLILSEGTVAFSGPSSTEGERQTIRETYVRLLRLEAESV